MDKEVSNKVRMLAIKKMDQVIEQVERIKEQDHHFILEL